MFLLGGKKKKNREQAGMHTHYLGTSTCKISLEITCPKWWIFASDSMSLAKKTKSGKVANRPRVAYFFSSLPQLLLTLCINQIHRLASPFCACIRFIRVYITPKANIILNKVCRLEVSSYHI